MVLSVLEDGAPRSVRQITREVTKAVGKTQKTNSINTACSNLLVAGSLARPSRGVYQRT